MDNNQKILKQVNKVLIDIDLAINVVSLLKPDKYQNEEERIKYIDKLKELIK